jgi:A/G-specific adenine glycosylase
MVEFCGADWRAERAPDWGLRHGARAAPIEGVDWGHAGEVDHIFTHFALNLTVFVGAAPRRAPAPEDCRWLNESEMRVAALPTVMRKVEARARAHLAASGLSDARIGS